MWVGSQRCLGPPALHSHELECPLTDASVEVHGPAVVEAVGVIAVV